MKLAHLSNLKYLKTAVKIVWKCSRRIFLARIFLSLVLSMLPLVTVYLLKLIVDSISLPEYTILGINAALFYILLSGITLTCQFGLASWSAFLIEKQQLVVHDYIAGKLHHQSIRVDLEYYENPKYFDTLHRAQHVAIDKPFLSFNNSLLLLQNALAFTAMAQLLTTFHWSIVLVLLVIVAPGIIFKVRYSEKVYSWDKKRTLTNRRTFYYNWLLTSELFAKEIRLFKLGRLFIERYRDLRKKLRTEKLAISKRKNIADFATQSLTVVAIYGALALMAKQAIAGKISVGDLVMYFTAFQRGMGFTKNILTNAAGLYDDSLYLSNLFEFLAIKPKVQVQRSGLRIKSLYSRSIVFDNVSFCYPGEKRKALSNVSFKVDAGEHIALVGENGAGKSTIIKLLCRLYDPTEGEIRVGETPLSKIHLDDWHKIISVVFQDFSHFNMRARDNIWFGNIEIPTKSKQIYRAAEFSGADQVIASLPNGYETILGKMWDEGTELSIGEWQKVALARAILRDSDIVILDEPTASLDARAEFEVFQHFQKLAAGKTAFLISHRLGSAQLADRILLFENGTIIEQGNHSELLTHAGAYAEMFQLQSKFYQK